MAVPPGEVPPQTPSLPAWFDHFGDEKSLQQKVTTKCQNVGLIKYSGRPILKRCGHWLIFQKKTIQTSQQTVSSRKISSTTFWATWQKTWPTQILSYIRNMRMALSSELWIIEMYKSCRAGKTCINSQIQGNNDNSQFRHPFQVLHTFYTKLIWSWP